MTDVIVIIESKITFSSDCLINRITYKATIKEVDCNNEKICVGATK